MKKFVILFTIISLIVLMFSCQLKDNANETNPVNPGTETLVTTSPKSGDTLFVSSSFDIKWTSNTTQKLLIDYTINNGANWNLIAANLDNTQSYIWSSIPNTPTTQGRVRITTADSTLNSISEGFFTIAVGTSKKITLSQPNGGESWKGNSNQAIKWTSINVDSVNIEYTLDNGLNWISIVSNFPSTGFYSWYPLPNTPASNAKVRVIDANDVLVTDLSDGTFSIEPEDLLTVTLPNGGEEWLSGSGQYIKWDTKLDITPGGADLKYTKEKLNIKNSNKKIINNLLLKNNNSKNILLGTPKSIESVEDVKIEYSFNGGASWNTIIETTPNNGIYFWSLVPNVNSTQCLIRVSDATDSVPFDFNDAPFSIFTSLPQEINITAPNGGETWASGTSQIISWNSKDVSLVKIEYTIDNGVNWSTIVESTQSDGFYSWEQIPAIAATNCRVRISDASDGSPSDMSSELFSISPEPNINLILLTPNGGENWIIGEPYEIAWTSENVERIAIDYSLNNGTTWDNILADAPSNGLFNWVVPDIQDRSDLCKIRIRHATDSTIFDLSDASFSIHPKNKLLRVVSPNGGEDVISGIPTRIEWTSAGVENVDIYFTIDNATTWHEIIKSYKSTGAYMWTPPDTSSSLARIKVIASNDINIKDESDSYFNIHKANDGTVEVIYPNGGEQLNVGGSTDIKWKTENVKNIKIEYSHNNGADWSTLIASTPTDPGFYKWNPIPTNQTSHGVVRISDASRSDINDISDSTFSINDPVSIPQVINITSPSGGEKWFVGDAHNIEWTSNNVGNITIEYSVDGNIWKNIVTNVANISPYSWSVPNDKANNVSIRIKEASDNVPTATSQQFSIQTQEITILSPNGGESWAAGEYHNINWTSKNIENIDIEYSLDQGNSWKAIASVAGTTNQYNWKVPNEFSDFAFVRVKDALDGSPVDISDAVFGIKPQPTINLISPNGGEILTEGSKKPITWSSQYVQNVRIEFSANNGGSWQLLIASTPSDGSWTWDPVSNNISDLCAIKISDADRNDISDVSASTFSIKQKIDQISGEPASIFLVSQSLNSIGVTESGSPETAQITFEVQDSSGTPIDIAHAVDISFKFGAQPNGGEILAPRTVRTNEKGQVTVNLTSGTKSGAVQVIAEINFNGNLVSSKPVNIAIHGGMPNLAHFSVGSNQLNYPFLNKIGEEGTITALVGDKYTNPVRPNTVVYFDSDAGVIEGSDLTNELGLTSVTLISGNPQPNDATYGAGFFFVHANTIDENNANISISSLVLFSGSPQISAAPLSFTLADGGSQSFTYTVMDQNGNPLAPGNEYTVSIATTGDAEVAGDVAVTMPDVQSGNTSFSFVALDSKPGEITSAAATITISVNGPNGSASVSISGTVE